MDERRVVTSHKRRTPRRLEVEDVLALALAYLQRYDVSEARLRRYLDGKVATSVRHHSIDAEPLRRRVDEVVASLRARGFVDDARHAEARAHALLERGRSPRDVRARLRAVGIDDASIDDAIAASGAERGGVDVAAAAAEAYARRRGLGPFRAADRRAERRDKDLMAMVRAGHALSIARQVIDGAVVDGALIWPARR